MTEVCIATDMTETLAVVPVPPVVRVPRVPDSFQPATPKLVAEWHVVQASAVDPATLSGGICAVVAPTSVLTPYQAMFTAWQVSHARLTVA